MIAREGALRGGTPRELPERRLVRAIQRLTERDELDGIPLASVLGAEFTTYWWAGYLTDRALASSSAWLQLAYQIWGRAVQEPFKPKSTAIATRVSQQRIAIEVDGTDPKVSGFWYPVAKLLGPGKCILVLRSRRLAAAIPEGFTAVAADDVRVQWSPHRHWVRKRLGRWKEGLRKISTEHRLAPSAPVCLLALLVSQVYRLAQAKALARSLGPRAFLSTWDHGSLAGPLCAVLSRQGVPTFTMIHGAIGLESMEEFAPLVADTVLVWGDYQRGLFTGAGVAASRIRRVGLQRMKRPLASRSESSPVSDGGQALDTGLRVILVGFTVLRTTDRAIWIDAVKRLVMSMPDSRFILRLHPSSKAPEYVPHFMNVPRVEVQEARQVSLEDVLAESDAVVVDSSTLGFDALLQGKLVAVLDPYPTPKVQDVMRDALEWEAAIYSKTPLGLAQVLKEYSQDQERRAKLLQKAKAFSGHYVSAYGEEAARRIVEVICEPQV
jgi:hypothetical protein